MGLHLGNGRPRTGPDNIEDLREEVRGFVLRDLTGGLFPPRQYDRATCPQGELALTHANQTK